jgi:hypothetical protein
MLKAQSDTERREAERAVAAVANTFAKDRRALPILEEIASTDDDVDAACSLLRVLGKTGGDGGLEMLRGALTEEYPPIVDAAIRGLAEWPDDGPMDDLLRIAQTSDNQTHRVLAIRAYLRMIGLDKDRRPEESLKLYRQAMDLAPDTNAKKMVLSGLAEVKSVAAMKFVADYVDDDELGAEAASAAVRIVGDLLRRGLGEQCRPILEKIAQTARNEDVREGAQEMIGWIEEEGDDDD